MLNLLLLAGTLSAIWFVFLMSIVSSGEAKVAEQSNSTSVNSLVEAIAADLTAATWTDLGDGATGLPSMTLYQDDEVRGLSIGETVRYEVAHGALERTSGPSTDIVMNGVRSVSFSRSGKTVTISLEVVSNSGTSETVEFNADLAAF